MKRALKWAAGLLGGAVLLLGGAVVAATWALDNGALTPRILAAIEAATGRTATLGRVSIGLGLTPRVTMQDATLANLPGGSRPDMARIRRMEASLALVPLLSGDIAFRAIAIDGADILLEVLPDGTPNWAFQTAPRDAAPAPTTPATPPAAERPRRRIAIGTVTLADSRISLPDRRLGTVTVESARVQGLGEGGVESVSARLALHGIAVTLEATVPPAPAPIRASLAAGTNRLAAEGRPGEVIALDAAIPDYAALRPLLALLAPDAPMPATMPEMTATLRLDADLRPLGGTLRAGAADLGAYRPGLVLTRLDVAAPGLDQPAEVSIEASQAGLPFTATLTLDRPGVLLPWAAEAPLALTLRAEAAGARAEATGRILRPRRLEAATADLRLAIPDMLAFAPVLPDPLPLRDATIAARVVAEGSLLGPLRIEALRVAGPSLAAEGDMQLTPGRPFGIEGRLDAERIDLDALARRRPAGAFTAAPTPAPAAPPPALPAAPATPQSAPPAPAPPPATEAGRRVIPDIALPLAGLATWQGRIALRAAQARIDGMDWRDLDASIVQAGDVLRIAPFSVISPGGTLRGELHIDRRASLPALALTLRSDGPGLDLAALRRAQGEAPGIEGRAQIAIDVTASGATTRALAASLSGQAGLAMVDGRITAAGLRRLGPDLVGLLLPGAARDGMALRCLALHIVAENGIATTRALLAETAVGRFTGTAATNLHDERLAARLLPDVQLLGVAVRAPVGVGGTLAAPRIGVDAGRAFALVLGDVAANRDPAGNCADQLRLARMGADGPERPPPMGAPRDLQGPAQDLLRGLFGGRRR